ncbi:hypothetical protein KIH27_18575 [Mycobacterium sp. M1]|uniref:RNA polymerase subunit sigma-70 n=1 Tax=Mycolicibacter acidiphilus TaxID=2835306 RepID=A0ABS5RMS5_9MYCO|nr:hypothetical protein [Mycolicibacter acidiphilus]MBS9535595.1 hypothetical protein [Mycolicibacter acidiphilus]
MDALTRLAEVAELISLRPSLIRQARIEGATWEQIAQAMRMSRAGAIKLANSAARAEAHRLDCPSSGPT